MGGYTRIFIASVAGIALVGGALYARTNANATADPAAGTAPAAALAALPRVYQPVADSDGDGTPDWQQELLGPRQEDAGSVPAEPFEPETLTDHLAVNFFTSYLLQKGRGSVNHETLVAQGVAQVAAMQAGTFYTRNDILVSPDGDSARLRDYGNRAGAAIAAYGRNDRVMDDEATILARALERNDPSLLSDLAVVEQRYADIIRELLRTPVPLPLANQHLALINALGAWRQGAAGMQKVFDDPLAALLSIKRYQEDTVGFVRAVDGVRRVLEANGIFYDGGEGGAFFFSLRP